VVPDTKEEISSMKVPTLNLTGTSLFRVEGAGPEIMPLLTRITASTASSSRLLPMVGIAPNASYVQGFVAPSMVCETATGNDLEILNMVWTTIFNMTTGTSSRGNYISFVAYAPYVLKFMGTTSTGLPDYSRFASSCIFGNADCAAGLASNWSGIMHIRNGDDSLSCKMYNTKFSPNFITSGDTQTPLQPVPYELLGPADDETAVAMAQGLVDILSGIIGVRTFGSEENGSNAPNLTTSFWKRKTRVMQTALIGAISTSTTNDLGYLNSPQPPSVPDDDRALARNLSIGALVEELSRNQTLSLFSSKRLW
jgi:hypothetical protein